MNAAQVSKQVYEMGDEYKWWRYGRFFFKFLDHKVSSDHPVQAVEQLDFIKCETASKMM